MNNLVKILEGCKVMDPKCQRSLYEQYRGFALKTVFRYIYRYEEATDVVTDGFVKLFQGFKNFSYDNELNAERTLMGWMKRIMINTAIDVLRKKSLLPEIGGIPEMVWDLKDNNHADHLLVYRELVEMIKELPPAYRIIFNMYVIDGYSHIEIASMLGIAVGTSKSGLSRARTILQNKLKTTEEMTHAAHR